MTAAAAAHAAEAPLVADRDAVWRAVVASVINALPAGGTIEERQAIAFRIASETVTRIAAAQERRWVGLIAEPCWRRITTEHRGKQGRPMQTIATYITEDERAALEAATLRAHLIGTADAARLGSLLDRIAPGNATTALLRRVERYAPIATSALLAPHVKRLDAELARRGAQPVIDLESSP